MKCSKAHQWISEEIDNGLNKGQRQQLQEHLQACRDCSALAIEMQRVVEQAGTLATVTPSDQVWSAIRRQVHAQERKPALARRLFEFFTGLRRPVLAYGIACMTIGLIALFWSMPHDDRGSFDLVEATVPVDVFKTAEAHYLKVIDLLGQELVEQPVRLNPELAAIFQQSLELIDASIVSLKTVIDQDPDGATANDYLLSCYQRKIEVLNQIRETFHQPEYKG